MERLQKDVSRLRPVRADFAAVSAILKSFVPSTCWRMRCTRPGVRADSVPHRGHSIGSVIPEMAGSFRASSKSATRVTTSWSVTRARPTTRVTKPTNGSIFRRFVFSVLVPQLLPQNWVTFSLRRLPQLSSNDTIIVAITANSLTLRNLAYR